MIIRPWKDTVPEGKPERQGNGDRQDTGACFPGAGSRLSTHGALFPGHIVYSLRQGTSDEDSLSVTTRGGTNP